MLRRNLVRPGVSDARYDAAPGEHALNFAVEAPEGLSEVVESEVVKNIRALLVQARNFGLLPIAHVVDHSHLLIVDIA